jgi:hypothetical protein
VLLALYEISIVFVIEVILFCIGFGIVIIRGGIGGRGLGGDREELGGLVSLGLVSFVCLD